MRVCSVPGCAIFFFCNTTDKEENVGYIVSAIEKSDLDQVLSRKRPTTS